MTGTMSVSWRVRPRSASRPASGAARVPPAPARANRAIPRWVRPKRSASISGIASRTVEGGKGQHLVGDPPLQRPQPQHAQHRRQQLAVPRSMVLVIQARVADRQHAPQHHRQHHHAHAGDLENRPPAEAGRQQAGERPRQHDAADQSAHDVADDAAALVIRREMRRQRDQHLGGDRAEPDHERRQQEGVGRAGQRHPGEAEAGYRQHHDDQATIFQQVGERHHQQQTGAEAELRQRHHQAGQAYRHVQRPADRSHQRLRIIDVGYDGAAGDREDGGQARRDAGRGGGRHYLAWRRAAQGSIMLRMRLPNVLIAKGLVSSSMPGASSPVPITAFSA